MLALYLPASPARLSVPSWIIILLWALLGVMFFTAREKSGKLRIHHERA